MFFNVLKEMYLECSGYDLKKIKTEKKEKEEMKKKDKIIFTNRSKHIIRTFGILYFSVAAICISSGITDSNFIEVIKYSFMLLLDIVGMIFISIKNKSSEIMGLCIIMIFVLINFMIPII